MSKKLPPELSGDTDTRTFRLPSEWDSILEYEANYNNTSVSSLLNQIVRRFVNVQRYINQNPAITMSIKTFDNLLNKMSEDEIRESARESGSAIPVDEILQRGAPLDFNSVKWFIEEMYGRYLSWFFVRYYTKTDITEFYFKHSLSYKWSIFLKHYFEALFLSVLDHEIDINAKTNFVWFVIPNKIRTDLLNMKKLV